MNKLLCFFGIHIYMYEDKIVTGKDVRTQKTMILKQRTRTCEHCGKVQRLTPNNMKGDWVTVNKNIIPKNLCN